MNETKEERDFGGHKATYSKWKEEAREKGIVGISKINSDYILRFIFDMELGQNIWRRSKKGGRSSQRLIVLKNKLVQFVKLLEERGIKDFRKVKEEELHIITHKLYSGEIKRQDGNNYECPAHFVSVFKTFWHWYQKISKKEGKAILDITEDLETSTNENKFVYLTKEDIDKLINNKKFDYNEKVMMKFMFDSFMRFPSEVLSLKVKDIYEEKDAVCVNVSAEVGTKTRSSVRNFNLLYCGEEILKYIKANKLESNDLLFGFMKNYNYVGAFNKKLKQVAVEIFGDKISHPVAGESYSKLSGYDFRHSGAIHFRLLASKNGRISLDVIRQRGGWSDFNMLNYYTKFLGLDGKIDKDMTLSAEDTTRLEKKIEKIEKEKENTDKRLKKIEELYEGLLRTAPMFQDGSQPLDAGMLPPENIEIKGKKK